VVRSRIYIFVSFVALSGIVSACASSSSLPTPGTPGSAAATPSGALSGTFTLNLPTASNGVGGSIVLNASNPVNVTIAAATASQLPAPQAHLRTAQSVDCAAGSLVAGYTLDTTAVQTTNTSVAATVSSSGVTFSNLPLSFDLTTAQLEIFVGPLAGDPLHPSLFALAVGPLAPTSTSGRSAFFTSGPVNWSIIVDAGANGQQAVSLEVLSCPNSAPTATPQATLASSFTFQTPFNSLGSVPASPAVIPTPPGASGFTVASLSLPGTTLTTAGTLSTAVGSSNFASTVFGISLPSGAAAALEYLTFAFSQSITFGTLSGITNDFCFPASLLTASSYTFTYFLQGTPIRQGSASATKTINDSTCPTSAHLSANSSSFSALTVPANTSVGLLISSP
jgi:hypothetical protein